MHRTPLMIRWTRTLALVAATSAALAAGCAEAAPSAAQNEPRVSIVLFPDVAGQGSFFPSCTGCDGEFTAEDALIASGDPLPPVDLELRDGAGMSQTATTSALAQGRQAAGFMVPAPGDYEVELLAVPAGWFLCPGGSATLRVGAADFSPDTGLALVRFPMTRGCAALVSPTPTRPAPSATAPAPPTSVRPAASATPPPTLALATRGATSTRTAPAAATTAAPAAAMRSARAAAPAARGSMRGLVFEDRDGDGALDPDEPGVAGVGVRMTGGGPWFAGQTAPNGSFEFPAVAAGSYDVAVDVPSGRTLTTTARYTEVAVRGETVLGLDFGLAPPGWVASEASPSDAAPGLPHTGFIRGDDADRLLGLIVLAAALGALGAAIERRRARSRR